LYGESPIRANVVGSGAVALAGPASGSTTAAAAARTVSGLRRGLIRPFWPPWANGPRRRGECRASIPCRRSSVATAVAGRPMAGGSADPERSTVTAGPSPAGPGEAGSGAGSMSTRSEPAASSLNPRAWLRAQRSARCRWGGGQAKMTCRRQSVAQLLPSATRRRTSADAPAVCVAEKSRLAHLSLGMGCAPGSAICGWPEHPVHRSCLTGHPPPAPARWRGCQTTSA